MASSTPTYTTNPIRRAFNHKHIITSAQDGHRITEPFYSYLYIYKATQAPSFSAGSAFASFQTNGAGLYLLTINSFPFHLSEKSA